jgi:hypothetical protein
VARSRLARTPLVRLSALVTRHGNLLWWLHSLYALAFGIGMMWVGARHYGLLRVAVLYVLFIWVTSLVMPAVVSRPWFSPAWRERSRLAINYFHRNFYQQMLFFLLPLYYASATWWSSNVVFVAVLAVSAVLSTLDVVYDRHISLRRSIGAAFFAFNLFACVNAMLPVVWRISNAIALPVSALAALVALATLMWRAPRGDRRPALVAIALSAAVLSATVTWGRAAIPPAPLRLASAAFGPKLDSPGPRLSRVFSDIPEGWSGPLHVLTAIRAPLGLEDRIGHRWYENGHLVYASPFYPVQGGRAAGFRLWTRCTIGPLAPGSRLRVDVVTETGQLVGRAAIAQGGP